MLDLIVVERHPLLFLAIVIEPRHRREVVAQLNRQFTSQPGGHLVGRRDLEAFETDALRLRGVELRLFDHAVHGGLHTVPPRRALGGDAAMVGSFHYRKSGRRPPPQRPDAACTGV